jgi:regulator of protease activity HflC (stomatin/prohibitin superfamily)
MNVLLVFECDRYEIRDIRLPAKVQEAMQMQVEAEVNR